MLEPKIVNSMESPAEMSHTLNQYDEAANTCRDLFAKKGADYGPAWRILRLSSMTDQIFIKVQRLRSIENAGEQWVEDDLLGEYIGIINYCAMALIQIDLGVVEQPDITTQEALSLYDQMIQKARNLMIRKNHDYGEAWRDMRMSSLTDLMLQKVLRIKQIEDNQGLTQVSEGIDANYLDMINYAFFAMIKWNEKENA